MSLEGCPNIHLLYLTLSLSLHLHLTLALVSFVGNIINIAMCTQFLSHTHSTHIKMVNVPVGINKEAKKRKERNNNNKKEIAYVGIL